MKKWQTRLSVLFSLFTLSSVACTSTPIIMGYYRDWDTYHNYPISGNSKKANNPDLDAKITGLNTLAYAFAEILTQKDGDLANIPKEQQAQDIGSIRFADAVSDLDSTNVNDTAFCNKYAYSCGIYNYKTSIYTPWPISGAGNFQAFVNTKVANHILSLGGAGHEDGWEAAIQNPQNFIASLQAIVNIYGCNGVDLNYEPISGIPSQYTQDFVNLIQQIHQAMPDLMITWPIVPNQKFINALSQSQWQTVSQNISYVSIMGYNMAGEFSVPQVTGLHSALIAPVSGAYNDDAIVKSLNAVGVSNSQIILGAPSYGRAVGGVPAAGIGQPFSLAVQGDLDPPGCGTTPRSPGVCGGAMTYTGLLAAGYTPTEVNLGSTDVGAYSYDPVRQIFVSYDSPTSISAKADYVIDNNLGGMMVWVLRFDAATNDPQSLLTAMDKAFHITPQPPQPGPGPTAGHVIVVNNNYLSGLGLNHSLNVILQEGKGPLHQEPTVTVGTVLAAPHQNSVLEYAGAFGLYNGPLTIWAQDNAVPSATMVQCATQSVTYSHGGQQITIYIVKNDDIINCTSRYSS